MPDDVQNSVPQKQQNNSLENMEQYLLHGRGSIIQKLRQLGKGKNMISVHFGGGKYSMLTLIVDVLSDRDLLVLDYGSNETINKKLLEAKRIVFKTQHEGITAQFTAKEIQRAKLHGKTAFACPIPETLLWVQRREYYRVRVPLGDKVSCELYSQDNETINFNVLDLSIGGLSLESSKTAIEFEPDQTFLNCKLVLSATGEGIVSLKVHNILPLKQDNPDAGNRIGCSYIDLSMDTSSSIQRYIHNIDAINRRIDK
jgi:c-di-GMP-binding flagellar brake protein YcgR